MGDYTEEYIIELLKIARLDQFDLPARIVKILDEDGVKTLYDICKMSRMEVSFRLPGIGEGRAKQISAFLSKYGLGFMKQGYKPYMGLVPRGYWKDEALFDYSKVQVDKIVDVLMRKQ